MFYRHIGAVALLAPAIPSPLAHAALQLTGTNLSGAEFGTVPGTYGTNYVYPNSNEVNYFAGKGMNVVRLPFRWERLQRTLNGGFDSSELSRLQGFVTQATGKGAYVVLDRTTLPALGANRTGTRRRPENAPTGQSMWNTSRICVLFGLLSGLLGMMSFI